MRIHRAPDKPGVVMIEMSDEVTSGIYPASGEHTLPAGMPTGDAYTKAWTAVAASIVSDLETQVVPASVPEPKPEPDKLRIALSTNVANMLEIHVSGVGTACLPVLRVREEAALAVPTARFWNLWNAAKEQLCRHVILRPADKGTWADVRRYKQRWTVSARFTR